MSFSKQNFSFLSLVGVVTVAGCAYSPASTSQKVTFLAPDAQGAQCLVSVDERKYNVSLPETVDIKVSANDMHLLCKTNDDKSLEQVVSPNVTTRAVWGSIKAGYYASSSTYKYPAVVSVDFSQVKPEKNAKILDNDDNMLKSMDLDDAEGLNSDTANDAVISNDSDIAVENEPVNLQAVIDDLSDSENSSVVDEPVDDAKLVLEAETQPVSIYPGQ